MKKTNVAENRTDKLEPCLAIIGAGFSGIGMAIRLKQSGYSNFTIFERSDNVGGTWRDNTYPGCACDVASHLYSFSFEKKSDWTKVFSDASEIYQYLLSCVEKFQLENHIKLNTTVSDMRFDSSANQWAISTVSNETFHADMIINGTGPLNKPNIPNIPGIENFTGKIFHSSQWDHEHQLDGGNVACIGTGASAIQFIPEIVNKVRSLKVFQRTPTWLVPRLNRNYSSLTKWVFKNVPGVRNFYRLFIYWRNEYYGIAIIGYPFFNNLLQKASKLYLRAKVKDPELRKKLTPNYQIGCKRINISDDYYESLQRPNSDLITEPIISITSTGVTSADGETHECDTIIFGTGFVTTKYLQPMKIYGSEGKELTEQWAGSAESYLGISVAGFPNYFLLLGPNTGLGHNSVVFMIEAQIEYVIKALSYLKEAKKTFIDVKLERQETFCDSTQKKLKKFSWGSGCDSWYLSENGKNYSIWPGFTPSYWWKTRKFDVASYHVS
jgi:cation diffusion facilitator CzcD-associated flavoprotein CzcO